MTTALFIVITAVSIGLIWIAVTDELDRRRVRREKAERRRIRHELGRHR